MTNTILQATADFDGFDGRAMSARSSALTAVLVERPSLSLLSIEEARAQVGVEDNERDAELQSLIAAASAYLDGPRGILGMALLSQIWRQDYPCFPRGPILRLPFGPILSVDRVSFLPLTGSERLDLTNSSYTVLTDATSPFLHLLSGYSWPGTATHPAAVSVSFTVGHLSAADVPEPIRQAAKLLVGQWFSQREAGISGPGEEIPFGVTRLLQPFRQVP